MGSEVSPELMSKIDNPIIFSVLRGDPGHGYYAKVAARLKIVGRKVSAQIYH